MNTKMKSYRLSQWDIDNIEEIKNMLNDMNPNLGLNNTDAVCRALNFYRDTICKEYEEWLKKS